MLNTTITIEHKSDYLNDSFDLKHSQEDKILNSQNEFMKSKSIPLSTSSSSSSSSPSTSPLADHYVSQNSERNCDNNQKSDELIENEIRLLNSEKNKLAKEKKLFYEQKLKFEKEANLCRKISTELSNAKREFSEEQEVNKKFSFKCLHF